MNNTDYKNSRNAALEILLACNIDRLPVNLNTILLQMGVRAYPYQGNETPIKEMGLERACAQTAGLTFYRGDAPIILYDRNTPPPRLRFTVAHELGHIALGHVRPGERTVQNREPRPEDSPIEQAANRFAVDLLAPACVLWGLGVHTPKEIAEVCAISRASAEFRAARMAELYHRGKFLTHPTERAVYAAFLPFIKECLGQT